MENRRIRIFDTTLRDGEQSPGASLFPEEKILLARQLERLGIDTIEPGFPASSPGDFRAVQEISRILARPEICGFARAVKGDIDAAVRATQDANRRRLHLFISSSQIHMDFQLKKSREQVLQIARDMVAYAKQFVDVIEFSPMDATRSGDEFLYEMLEGVIAEGATILNIPDTVGYALPEEYGNLFRRVRANVRGGDRVEYSAHCHNDLGLAVANSLAAIAAGATHVEVSVNGIGERAGNCSLEELVMAIATRGRESGLSTGVDLSQIYETSRMVSRIMNLPIAYNKPIVGRNAFQHEAGIHQDGLLKNRSTYEIMDPEKMGIPRDMIVLGKHSGRHALKHRLERYGVIMEGEELARFAEQFKQEADAYKVISDAHLLRILDKTPGGAAGPFSMMDFQVVSNHRKAKVASVTLRNNRSGEETTFAAAGDGPVEAIVACLRQAVDFPLELTDMEIHSLSASETAQGEAQITVRTEDDRTYRGSGIHTDILAAVAEGYLSALNQAVSAREEKLSEKIC
ncbi:2-isopropylmalate synthase [Paenibacillus sp. YN15]|uniref:2-isopropylmalate synthase n=1 Tax=Paenibacillus sp. YN15 TaxID=1742774 RepID=UPI000DCD403C|nr:2-isopropylmalate synthase [Paenibacillus sp. YN15]RAU95693.1 2-isopropylmalate synthase [Paenibacillus sp. YN15]